MSVTLAPSGGRGAVANLSVLVKIGIIVAVGVAVSLAVGILGLHALNGAASDARAVHEHGESRLQTLLLLAGGTLAPTLLGGYLARAIVRSLRRVKDVIARISDFQTTIASAVEEQTATTAEMNRSVSEAAAGSGEIARNITGVASAARQTTEGVRQSQRATAELARMSAELTSLVSTFRY